MATIIYILLALLLGFYVGRLSAPVVVRDAPAEAPQAHSRGLPAPPHRCHTITYLYSDASTKTFHGCQGHVEFTDAFGRDVAPPTATLISATGGVHLHEGVSYV
jgi:hypothetical protein